MTQTTAHAAKVKFVSDDGKETFLRLPKENLSEEEQIRRMEAFAREEDIHQEIERMSDRLNVLMNELEKCRSVYPKLPGKVLTSDYILWTLMTLCSSVTYDDKEGRSRLTGAHSHNGTKRGVDLITRAWNETVAKRSSKYANGAVSREEYLHTVINTYPCASDHPLFRMRTEAEIDEEIKRSFAEEFHYLWEELSMGIEESSETIQ